MAVVFVESWDAYTRFQDQYHGKWNSVGGSPVLAEGRKGVGLCMRPVGSKPVYTLKDPFTSHLIVGFALYLTTFGLQGGVVGGLKRILDFKSPAGEGMGHLCVNNAGQLAYQIEVNGTYNPVGVTGDSLVLNRWHYVEVELTSAGVQESAGNSAKIYIDGVLAGWTTGSLKIGDIHWFGSAYTFASVTLYDECTFDDMYCADGDSVPLGDQKALWTPLTGDVAVQFTPSQGTVNFGMVDEQGADEDATYVSSQNKGVKDVLSKAALGLSPDAVVAAIQVAVRGKKTDVGTRTVSPLVQSNGQETTHDDQALALDYRYRYTVFEHDPDGDVPWTPAAVDAANVGYETD